MSYADTLLQASEDETCVCFMVYVLFPTASLFSNPDSIPCQHVCQPMSAANAYAHAYELIVFVAEANHKLATVKSLLALVFQTYRPMAHNLV